MAHISIVIPVYKAEDCLQELYSRLKDALETITTDFECLLVFCWAAFLVVIFKIDPFSSGFIGLFSFYLILFLAFMGTLSLIGFFIRSIFLKKTVLFRHIGISLRQAIMFSVLIVVSLMLQANKLFTWWNAILLILSLTLMEFFFLAREGRRENL